MRLFIAIDFSELKDCLSSLQDKFLEIDGLRLRPVKSYHLTLKFLGSVMPDKFDKVKRSLGDIRFTHFGLSLDCIGLFPTRKSPRVIWIGVKPEAPVVELQEEIEKRLKGLFEPEKKFMPHITLARVKYITNKDFLGKTESIKVKPESINVEQFSIFKSTLAKEGAIHEIIKSYRAE